MKTFGSHIRKIRQDKKLGLREVATFLGIAPSYLSDIEKDRRNPPRNPEVIRKLAQILGEKSDSLMNLAGNQQANKIPPDMTEVFSEYGNGAGALLRTIKRKGLSKDQVKKLIEKINEIEDNES